MTALQSYFADLHIHIGRTRSNKMVKITASRSLTFTNILQEAAERKGLHLIGIIDAHVPEVQDEIQTHLDQGRFHEHPDGGICYRNTTCLLGAEIEVREPPMSPVHLLAYLPNLTQMRTFTAWLAQHMKNVHLSTQRLYQPAHALLEKVEELGGVLIPAHLFTPFRSLLGSATDRISRLLPTDRLLAVELGLSSDSQMADQISELRPFTFLTNSDAHSLPKIGREYQQMRLKEASFLEWRKALLRDNGRAVIANYGLNPLLGKYYQSCCAKCYRPWEANAQYCRACQSSHKVRGVAQRIQELADQSSAAPNHRPPYHYQIPLEFLPKVGPKKMAKLYTHIGTEMDILHRAPLEKIASCVGEAIASRIQQIRKGQVELLAGGGGKYGQMK